MKGCGATVVCTSSILSFQTYFVWILARVPDALRPAIIVWTSVSNVDVAVLLEVDATEPLVVVPLLLGFERRGVNAAVTVDGAGVVAEAVAPLPVHLIQGLVCQKREKSHCQLRQGLLPFLRALPAERIPGERPAGLVHESLPGQNFPVDSMTP